MSDNVVRLPANGRKLASWVDAFMEYTDGIQSPEIFRRWSAICAIAGALEQRVWLKSQGAMLFPNLYVFLVGPPGSGKSFALHECEALWRELGTHHVAPVSLTKPALMDALNEAKRVINGTEIFNSLLVAAGELGALIPGYDADFLNALTYLYDCKHYEERRRSIKEPLVIPRPQINLLACCTPSFLTSIMPPGAWEQGFLARVIIIYSDVSDIRPLDFSDTGPRRNDALRAALMHDIKAVGAEFNYRRLSFTPEAFDLINNWHESKGPWAATGTSAPDHPRLIHYGTRRPVHMIKLCMIANANRTNSGPIEPADFYAALNWLTEAEGAMPNVFKAMSSGGDAQVIQELWHYVMRYNQTNQRSCPAYEVHNWLQDKVSAYSADGIVKLMERSHQLVTDEKGNYTAKGWIKL